MAAVFNTVTSRITGFSAAQPAPGGKASTLIEDQPVDDTNKKDLTARYIEVSGKKKVPSNWSKSQLQTKIRAAKE